jgi:hypothetical protein
MLHPTFPPAVFERRTMKRLTGLALVAVAICGLEIGIASGTELGGGTSKSGRDITLRVPVELCAGFYPGDDQILAGIGCKEPVEHFYKGGFAVVQRNRCKAVGSKAIQRKEARPLQLLRSVGGKSEVISTGLPGYFQGWGLIFDARRIFGPEYQGPFPPGEYSVRVKGFSYRGKIWQEHENVYYHDAKIVCADEERKVGTIPTGYLVPVHG